MQWHFPLSPFKLNTGIGNAEVHKHNLSVALGKNLIYASNDYETNVAATAMLKPVSSGIQILKSGIYIAIARFSIMTQAGSRISFGCRNFKSASDYVDSIDGTSSASSLEDNYVYIRMGLFDEGTYLRPVVSAPNGGTCYACTLSVISLKARA